MKRQTRIPWTIRLFDSIPLVPIWIGLSIAGLWLSFFSIYAYLVGWIDGSRLMGVPFWESSSIWFEVLHAMMIGYALTATAYWMRGAVGDLHALRPVLRCTDKEFQAELRALTGFERRPLVVAILIGVAIGLAAALNPGGWVGERPPPGHPLLNWVILKSVVLFSLIAHSVHISIALTSRLSRIGGRSAQVDLLDVAPLAPFARNGLRGALFLMGWIVLTSLSLLAPWSGDVAIGGLCVVLALAVAALLGPVVGVHRRVHEAKRVELERVWAAIRRESARMMETRGEWQPADVHLSDLIVYKGIIESVNTWLFDLPAMLKFSFIVVVGVGSWLGQAFVERLLGMFID